MIGWHGAANRADVRSDNRPHLVILLIKGQGIKIKNKLIKGENNATY